MEMQMSSKAKASKPADPEKLLDEALEETFPASDPISPAVGPGEPIGESGENGKPEKRKKEKKEK
jgi:hypothetical protein